MMMRVDDVLDRLVGDLLQLRHDAVVIDLELVVYQHDALVGDERRRVARDEVVVDDVKIVLTFTVFSLAACDPNCWPCV